MPCNSLWKEVEIALNMGHSLNNSYIAFSPFSLNFYFHKWQWVFSHICVCVCTYVHLCVRTLDFKYWPGTQHQDLVTPQMLNTQKSGGHLWFLLFLTLTPTYQLILALLPPAYISDASTSLYFHCSNISLHYPSLRVYSRHPHSIPVLCNALSTQQ